MKKAIIARMLWLCVYFSLLGCSSLSKQECLVANWKLIGFEDGSKGKPESTIGAHRKACAKVSVTPDLAQYQQGHREGARKYCVKVTAYKLGVDGGAYYNVCPADLEPAFLTAYRAGQELYAMTRQIASLQANINNDNDSIRRLDLDIQEHEKNIVDSTSTSKERREQLHIIEDLRHQITDLEIGINNAQQDINNLQWNYQNLQSKHRAQGYTY